MKHNWIQRVACFTLLCSVVVSVSADNCAREKSDVLRQECKTREIKEADSRLNQIYRNLHLLLDTDGSARMQLQTAERAWIEFRDSSCAFEAEHLGEEKGWLSSSLKEYARSECIYRMTMQRSLELGSYTRAIFKKMGHPMPTDNLPPIKAVQAPRIIIKQNGLTMSCVAVPNAEP